MCRITGFWNFNDNEQVDSQMVIKKMRDSMTHGGPDDSGVYEDKNHHLCLAHRRLSIIDLSKHAQQPMQDETNRWVLCYNGEIYNFKAIRQELEKLGDVFNTQSDTEVLLKAWVRWQENALEKLRGMFAFVVFDKQNHTLTLVRDRMGVKPLYWYFYEGLFMFSSELKAFHQHPQFCKRLNQDALKAFLKFGYIAAPQTIFEHTYKLKPAHVLRIDAKQNMHEFRYWDLKPDSRFSDLSETAYLTCLEDQLKESFSLRMVSDVPVGVFLSGGVDSSLLTSLLQSQSSQKIKTFNIAFQGYENDESQAAKNIADYLKTEHYSLNCSMKEALEIIPDLATLYDEPFGDTSAIPTYMVSKLSRQYVKVALSADGGDEQFAGYKHYKMYDQIQKLKKIPGLHRILKSVDQSPFLKTCFNQLIPLKFMDHRVQKLLHMFNAKTFQQEVCSLKSAFPQIEYDLKPVTSNQHQDDRMLFWDMCHYLPDDILCKVDRASMAVGLEAREPFLDHHLITLSASLSYKQKIKHNYCKYPLRQILNKYLPETLSNQPKKGFAIPLFEWLKKDLNGFVIDVLDRADLSVIHDVDSTQLQGLIDEFKQDNYSQHPLNIWYLFVFFMWYEQWMN